MSDNTASSDNKFPWCFHTNVCVSTTKCEFEWNKIDAFSQSEVSGVKTGTSNIAQSKSAQKYNGSTELTFDVGKKTTAWLETIEIFTPQLIFGYFYHC